LETKAKETRSKVIIGDVAESIETKPEVCCHGVRQWFLSIRPSRPSGALALIRDSRVHGGAAQRRNRHAGLAIGALFAVVSAARAQFAGLRDSPNLTSGLISGRQRGHIGGGKT
jgi:tetrahydromethanopterin S-methyltransferase subunit F